VPFRHQLTFHVLTDPESSGLAPVHLTFQDGQISVGRRPRR